MTNPQNRSCDNEVARVILFTGKGGVGKTSSAAATAVKAAQMGKGVLVVSTDAAHSLSDSFDQKIESTPTQLNEKLWAQEIDVNRQIEKNWGPIHNFITKFLHRQGFDSVIADELAVFPGMEEIFSLLELKEHALDPKFDVVIIDCAPTADTARLLALPDIARWYMEKIFRIERAVIKTVRPVAQRLLDMPLPTDDVFEATEKLYHQVMAVKDILVDRERTSMRLVLNPEKMVVKEAQRAYTFLGLFDFGTDAVVVNRMLPDEIKDPYYDSWRKIQAEHFETIKESFYPLPILTARLWKREIVGLELLSELAREIYGERNPIDVFHHEKALTITPLDKGYLMEIPVSFAAKEELDTWIHGDELVIKYKNFKRNLVLPRTLANLELIKAEFRDQRLKLTFGGNKNGGKN